jgi:uncharacterized membrane protein YkvA (DUF1232 family)
MKKPSKRNPFSRYAMLFSEQNLWNKIAQFAKQAGIQTIYAALLLYYAFKRKETPRWAKNVVIGVLGYFLAPIDGIPDLTPFIGYTDDIGVLIFGLVTISAYVNKEVKDNAKTKLVKWFGNYDTKLLKDVEDKI